MSYEVIHNRLDSAGDELELELALDKAEKEGKTLVTAQAYSPDEGLTWVFALFHKKDEEKKP